MLGIIYMALAYRCHVRVPKRRTQNQRKKTRLLCLCLFFAPLHPGDNKTYIIYRTFWALIRSSLLTRLEPPQIIHERQLWWRTYGRRRAIGSEAGQEENRRPSPNTVHPIIDQRRLHDLHVPWHMHLVPCTQKHELNIAASDSLLLFAVFSIELSFLASNSLYDTKISITLVAL